MRLICPNCGAQYEVDDQVIPNAGRDVQCSNCGHTWFQQPAHMDPDLDLAEEFGEELPPPDDAQEDEVPEQVEDPDEPPEGPQRTGLDPEVANVLREEAEREAEARRAENDGLETQPDLGLDDAAEIAADRSAAARARMARLRGDDDVDAEAAVAAGLAAGGSRRDLLPDIDEINSSLRASQDRDGPLEDPDEPPSPQELKSRRSGFRLGFSLMVLGIAIAVILYVFASQIVAIAPATEPVMIKYVAWANVVREQIDTGVDGAVTWVQSLIGGGEGDS